MESDYNADVLKITKKEGITDAVVIGNFVPPGAPVNNLKPAIKPISINIPGGSKIMPTHTCELNIDGITYQSIMDYIAPGLAHASLISISALCDAGCNVKYGESICSVYFKNKLVCKGGREPHK